MFSHNHLIDFILLLFSEYTLEMIWGQLWPKCKHQEQKVGILRVSLSGMTTRNYIIMNLLFPNSPHTESELYHGH